MNEPEDQQQNRVERQQENNQHTQQVLFEEQQEAQQREISSPPASVSVGASSARLLRNAAINAAALSAAAAARPLSRGRGRGPSAQPSNRRVKRLLHDHLSLGVLRGAGALTEEELAERLQHLYIAVEHKSFLEPLARPDNKDLLRDFRRGYIGAASLDGGTQQQRGRRGFRATETGAGASSGLSGRAVLAEQYSKIDRRLRPLLLERARDTLRALAAENSVYDGDIDIDIEGGTANTPMLTDLEALFQRFSDRKGLVEADVQLLNARIARAAAGTGAGASGGGAARGAGVASGAGDAHVYGEELLRILKAPLSLSTTTSTSSTMKGKSKVRGKAHMVVRFTSDYSRMLAQGLAVFCGPQATPLSKGEDDAGAEMASYGDYSALKVSTPLKAARLPFSVCTCPPPALSMGASAPGGEIPASSATAEDEDDDDEVAGGGRHPLDQLTALRCKLGTLAGVFDKRMEASAGAQTGSDTRLLQPVRVASAHSRSPSPAVFAASLPVLRSAAELERRFTDASANSPFFEAVRARAASTSAGAGSRSRGASASVGLGSLALPSAAVPGVSAVGMASLPAPPASTASAAAASTGGAGGGSAPVVPVVCKCTPPLCPLFLLYVKSLGE